jgi:amino acid transporter
VIKKKKKISLFILIMLSSAFVISIRNIPAMAETRLQVFFFGIIAALFFFIPTALVSAELATGWSREGGIFVWVTEAFGKKWGFWASWLQWTSMLLNVITMLFFVGGSLAYVINPALASSKIFLIVMLLIVLWGITFLSLKGIRTSGFFSAVCFIGGVLFPIFLIVLLAFIYLLK